MSMVQCMNCKSVMVNTFPIGQAVAPSCSAVVLLSTKQDTGMKTT